ncbi:MAG TPA: LLM class flavin-dependent oxidoreductase [Actinomycetota bacterium]|nr:LLM class flavin-dependent oxidoreductase [Actinomycetota bacterium]
MKLGLSLGVFTTEIARPLEIAGHAARAGYELIVAPDHLHPPGDRERPSIDAFTLLSAVAAANPSVGVGPLVSRASLRPVGLLAKQAAALDHLCGGRGVVGLGAGDRMSQLEHETYGVRFPPVPERLAGLGETALALRALFRGEPWGGGDVVPPIAGPLLPSGSPPVWVGGLSDGVLREAARAADAWNGWGLGLEGFRERVERLRAFAEGAGRAADDVPPTWAGIALVGEDARDLAALERARDDQGLPGDVWRGTADGFTELVGALAALGTTWCIVLPAGPRDRIDVVAAAFVRAMG